MAIGQDQFYWTTKVTSLLETVGNSLENLRSLVINPESVDALEARVARVLETHGSRASLIEEELSALREVKERLSASQERM